MSDFTAQSQRKPLHRAAQYGDLARVEALIARTYPVNRFDEVGHTPLHHAVQGNHLDVVRRLIRAGADVNAHDTRLIGNTPLSDNICTCTYDIAKTLIDAGADPTIRGWMQLNALDRLRERRDADAEKITRLLRTAANGRRV